MNVDITTSMVGAVFAASVLGSLHCAGMCGAFVAIAVGGERRGAVSTQAAYHLGRLTTYTVLGAAAGSAGAALNLGSRLAGLSPIAMSLAGLTIVLFGSTALLRQCGVRLPHATPPRFMQNLFAAGLRKINGRGPLVRAGSIGLLTTLLPCGWLYAFVATAAGTASPLTGAAVMAIFWVGTLPMLVAVGTGARLLLGPVGRYAPAITSIALIAVGLFTLSQRARLDVTRLLAHAQPQQPQGEATSVPSADETPACCREEP